MSGENWGQPTLETIQSCVRVDDNSAGLGPSGLDFGHDRKNLQKPLCLCHIPCMSHKTNIYGAWVGIWSISSWVLWHNICSSFHTRLHVCYACEDELAFLNDHPSEFYRRNKWLVTSWKVCRLSSERRKTVNMRDKGAPSIPPLVAAPGPTLTSPENPCGL